MHEDKASEPQAESAPTQDELRHDVERLVAAVGEIAAGDSPPVTYDQDSHTGDYWPRGDIPGWTAEDRTVGASCARG